MTQASSHIGKTSRRQERHELGLRVASLLRGAWRANPLASVNFAETELAEITPLLCQTGAGALAWSRIAQTPLADTASGRTLHEVYRQSRLSSLIREREIAYVLSLLRDEGIEPVLVKGWAMARRYPDRALRPSGDIDLCVRPDQFNSAACALKCLENIDGHYVDLHCGFRVGQPQPSVEDIHRLRRFRRFDCNADELRVWDELYSRSVLFNLDSARRAGSMRSVPGAVATGSQVSVRVLSDEDHLRLLCSHLLRSGARRPAWLCDIALLVEQIQSPKTQDQRPNFDWNISLGGNPLDANWISSALGLAHELLGANIDHTPFAKAELSRWLAPAVLQQWGGRVKSPVQNPTSRSQVQSPTSKVQSQDSARRHWTLDVGHWTDLYARWDNPIRAVAAVGGEFNNWPRLPYRLAESIKRAWPLATDH